MIGIVLRRTYEEFLSNFKVALSFAVLLAFFGILQLFNGFFYSGGTLFASLDFNSIQWAGLFVSIIFLYLFSFFVSLAIYSIKRDIQNMKFDAYWNDLMKKAAVGIFVYYFLLMVFCYIVLAVTNFFFTGSASQQIWGALICLIVSLLTMYVPQAIVLERTSLIESIKESVLFWKKHKGISAFIVLVGAALLIIVNIIETIFGTLNINANIVIVLLVLVGIIPFIEQMKTYAFILRHDLIKNVEIQHSMHIKKHIENLGVRLRQKGKKL
jgi:hypothetical protein